MPGPEDELDEIQFGDPDDEEAHVGSVLVLRKGCTLTSKMSMLELLTKGVAEILGDISKPEDSDTPDACKEMSEYAHAAFAAGKPVTMSLTLMPEAFLRAEEAKTAEGTGDDGLLLN